VDVLNAEKTAIIQPNSKITALIQEKKMELCETCGSFLVANDAADRAQSHVAGKQHIGYSMIREFLANYKVICDYLSGSLVIFPWFFVSIKLMCTNFSNTLVRSAWHILYACLLALIHNLYIVTCT
jgi:LUC7 N_terminus